MASGKELVRRAKNLDLDPRLLRAVRAGRRLLPGDDRFGDPLSTGGQDGVHAAGRRLSAVTAERPGVLREVGLGALQVWQSVAESQGRGRGDRELTIVFTDLVGFSDWTLEAGDEAALELLRDVGQAIEPPVTDRGGRIVKRLGDGLMAVFPAPQNGLDALLEAHERIAGVRCGDYVPQMRAGLHVGAPRRLGGDYLGVDVNIAARVAEEAKGGETLVSDRALPALDVTQLKIRKRRRFKVSGVPKDLVPHSVAQR